MPEGNKGYTYVSKLDEILEQYSRKGIEHHIDIYSDAKTEPEKDTLNCRFKDNCYTLKSKQGNCPCELNE